MFVIIYSHASMLIGEIYEVCNKESTNFWEYVKMIRMTKKGKET